MNSVNLLMLGKQVRGVFRCFSLMVSFFYLQELILEQSKYNFNWYKSNSYMGMYNLPTLNVAQVQTL